MLWMSCLEEEMHHWKTCLAGIQVLLGGLLYWGACIAEGHVLQEDLFYWRAYCAVVCAA